MVEEKYLSDDALAEIEKRRKQMEEMRMKEKKRQTELLEIQSIQGKIDASSADSVFSEMSQHKPEDLIEKHVRTGNGLRVVLDAANIGWGYGGYVKVCGHAARCMNGRPVILSQKEWNIFDFFQYGVSHHE